jgi:hypothetical protein
MTKASEVGHVCTSAVTPALQPQPYPPYLAQAQRLYADLLAVQDVSR